MAAPPSPGGGGGGPSPPTTFHRRPLPPPAVAFSSLEGQRMFAEALGAGTVGGCFFRLVEQFHTQNEPSFCGLGTLTMVLNALNVDPKTTWKGPWRWFHEDMLSCCEPLDDVKRKGIVWDKWLCLARCNGVFARAHRADEAGGDLESFRVAVRTATSQVVGSSEEEKEPLTVLVVSYSRKQFRQTGDGHFSPIGGYHAASDSVLVLDVARFKHPPHWVKLSEMHESMRRADPETGRSRGFALLSAQRESGGWLSMEYRTLARAPPHGRSPASGQHLTLDTVTAAFAEAVGGTDFPASLGCKREALANEAVRRAVRFVEGPLMPLSVACLPAMPPQRPSGDSLGDQLPEAEKARANEEWESRQQTLRDLKEVARCINEALVGGTGCSHTSAMCEGVCFGRSDEGEFAGCELRAALILCLDLSMWTAALCPEDAPKAEPPAPPEFTTPSLTPTEIVDMQSGAVSSPGAQAWEVLKPLLGLEALPTSLRHQVVTLRAQTADLLTRNKGGVAAGCRGLDGSCHGKVQSYAPDGEALGIADF